MLEDQEKKERYRTIHMHVHPDKEFSYVRWRSFRYNEVVGWIVIYANVSRIRAEYWLTRERVMKDLIRKTYTARGKLCQFNVRNRGATSIEIFEGIRRRLLAAVSEDRNLAKRWVDTKCFETVGRAMNWREVMRLPQVVEPDCQ